MVEPWHRDTYTILIGIHLLASLFHGPIFECQELLVLHMEMPNKNELPDGKHARPAETKHAQSLLRIGHAMVSLCMGTQSAKGQSFLPHLDASTNVVLLDLGADSKQVLLRSAWLRIQSLKETHLNAQNTSRERASSALIAFTPPESAFT